jgi:hypothetical protein
MFTLTVPFRFVSAPDVLVRNVRAFRDAFGNALLNGTRFFSWVIVDNRDDGRNRTSGLSRYFSAAESAEGEQSISLVSRHPLFSLFVEFKGALPRHIFLPPWVTIYLLTVIHLKKWIRALSREKWFKIQNMGKQYSTFISLF